MALVTEAAVALETCGAAKICFLLSSTYNLPFTLTVESLTFFTFSYVDSPTIGLHMLKQSKYFGFWTVGLVRMLYFTCNDHRT